MACVLATEITWQKSFGPYVKALKALLQGSLWKVVSLMGRML